MSLLFSIVIPTHNRPFILTKTLDCIERQEVNFKFEAIIIDDGSTVTLPDLGFGKGKRANWKLLRNEKNMGRAATRNRGIGESRGDYILMIDDDIWASPGLLQAHYQAQQRIGGGVVIGAVPPASDVSDTVWHRYLAKRYERIHKRLGETKLDYGYYGLFFTGNVSLPLSLLRAVGAFEETFKDYSFEDTELGFRLHKAGMKFCYAPSAVGYHMFDENLSSLCNKSFQLGFSAYIFVKLHPEEARNIQYHSMICGPWQGINIIKNLFKVLLFNIISIKTLILFAKVGEIIKQDFLVFSILPWVELANSARGAQKARLTDKTFS